MLLLLAPLAGATEAYEQQLPLAATFSCANCHQDGATPTPSDPALNEFGLDFFAVGAWNSTLANLDSDGDGCTNGAEVGDVDGNGQPDVGVTEASSNPGLDGDCSSASVLEELNWGELKTLFNS